MSNSSFLVPAVPKMLPLPDSNPTTGEAVLLKRVNVAICSSSADLIKEPFTGTDTWEIKQAWAAEVTRTGFEDGFMMTVTRLACTNWTWKLSPSELQFTFENKNFSKKVVKSVAPPEFKSTSSVCLSREEIQFLLEVNGAYSNHLLVSLTVKWIEKIAFCHRMPINYDFHSRTSNSSLVIECEDGERFFVNLEYLAQLSHYFSALSRNLDMVPLDKATNLKLLKLDDVTCWDFEQFLALLYPSKKQYSLINGNNLEIILKLTDRFLCYTVRPHCFKAMISLLLCENACPAQLLTLCEVYNMDSYVHRLIMRLFQDDIRDMIAAAEFDRLSQRTMKLIAIRLTQIVHE